MKAIHIDYGLEIIFLRAIVSECNAIRQRHDISREKFSTAINELFNISWAKTSEPIKRGAMIGALKSGESVLNETQAYIYKLETLILGRVSELINCQQALDQKKKKGKK